MEAQKGGGRDMYACACVCVYVQYSQRPEEGTGSPREVKGKLPGVAAG